MHDPFRRDCSTRQLEPIRIRSFWVSVPVPIDGSVPITTQMITAASTSLLFRFVVIVFLPLVFIVVLVLVLVFTIRPVPRISRPRPWSLAGHRHPLVHLPIIQGLEGHARLHRFTLDQLTMRIMKSLLLLVVVSRGRTVGERDRVGCLEDG